MLAQTCPDFSLPSTSGTVFTLSTAPKPLVLYFYPRDNTPGCTSESIDFKNLATQFSAAGVHIAGISRDNIQSHLAFKTQYALPFELLSDEDETVCQLFSVMKLKNMYGKQVRGIERSTFIIDSNNKVIGQWRKVNVTGHAQEVLGFVLGGV